MKQLKFTSIIGIISVFLLSIKFANANSDSTKIYFQQSFTELKNMLEGKQPASFERAVFISENPYLNNRFPYANFQKVLSSHIYLIEQLMEMNNYESSNDFRTLIDFNAPKFDINTLNFTEKEKKEMYRKTLANWAIFKYITDTTLFSNFVHLPFTYQFNDPFGMNDWKNSQVINLLSSKEQKGNCFALVSLYKIFSDRLNSGAFICTAPQHIYIQHQDHKGDYYNVELATGTHPGDGSIQTLTYTFYDGIVNGISLRRLKEEKQNIALCLVNLGKSYEHKFKTKDDDFLLQCAELALKYDSLNLNAMLLKEQVLEARIVQYASKKNIIDINKLRTDVNISSTFKKLETQIVHLYELGYYQMPLYMQEMILAALKREDNKPIIVQDRTPDPFPSIKNASPEDKRYSTLSGGLFEEVKVKKQFEQYGQFTLDTEKKKLVKLVDSTNFKYLIDPVVFAWSVDPMAHKYPSWSPYAAFFNNPIYYIDPDGKEGIGAVDHKNKTVTIKAVYFTEIGKSGFNKENLNQLQGLNATLNSNNYTITDETNSLHGYTVQFDLQFVPVNAAEKAQQFAVSEQQLTANNATGGTNLIEGGFNIGNSLILTDDPSFEAITSIKETAEKNKVGADKVLGITDASLQHINIPQKSQGNVKTALHEIFHTLYFDKDGANKGIGSGKELPNQSDINDLIKGVQDQGRIVE